MIESPTAVLFEPLQGQDPDALIDSKKGEQAEPELILVKQKPITAKFHATIQHLRARAGIWSRFRGLSLFLLHSAWLGRLTVLFRNLNIPIGVDAILASVVLAQLRMTWTHIAITESSPKYWFSRVPNYKLYWKKVAVPTAILAAAQQVTLLLPVALACTLGLNKITEPKQIADMIDAERQMFVVKVLGVALTSIFIAFAIVIPASVSLTRIQASLLPEDNETIVPFDRSFGGRVVPAIDGGIGAISMLEAWKTFGWSQRVNLLKIYIKVGAMQIATMIFITGVMAAEIHLIVGEELGNYIAYATGQN